MTTVWHGPTAWESPAPCRYGLVARVAVMSDVHANVAALTEVITPATPDERFVQLCAGVDEQVLVTGHTHLQFDPVKQQESLWCIPVPSVTLSWWIRAWRLIRGTPVHIPSMKTSGAA